MTAHDILDEQSQMLVLNAWRNLVQGILEKDFF